MERRLDYQDLDTIEPAPNNPKEHQIDGVRASIDRFGYVAPMIIDDRTGRLVVGHGRLESLKARRDAGETPPEGIKVDDTGRWLAPVIRGWSSRSDADAAAYLVLDNRQTELGGWDHQALSNLLEEIGDPDLVELTGWDPADLEELLDSIDDGGPGPVGDGEKNPSLADRFGVPPFDVLDARQGYWRDRKRSWLRLGLKSETGRGDRLAFKGIERADPQYYQKKTAVETSLGRTLTSAEFFDQHYEPPTEGPGTGTSIFDPVICELVYRWFTPPGGSVLDPFAGGSVRGIVAAATGRHYYGVDLRPEQVDANRVQAQQILATGTNPGRPGTVDDPSALTPIETHGGYLVKRDDLFAVNGSRGGKVRSCLVLMTQPDVVGVVTAGSRHSPQVNIVATIAGRLGLPCRVHVPSGDMTPELTAATAAGAELIQHNPGYNNVIIKRARDDAEALGWLNIPFGMECPEAVLQTANQTAHLGTVTPTRIVVPVGSGMSLAGILTGMATRNNQTPVVGVVVGADPTERLDAYAPSRWRDMITLVESGYDYAEHHPAPFLGDLDLDPVYEAKCLPHLQPGDLLWVVGRRETAGGPAATIVDRPPMPEWTCGDSSVVVPRLSAESVDLIFTCPPYYDLETYGDDPADLSTMDYDTFDHMYEQIIEASANVLRPNRFAVIVTGDARDKRGILHDLRGETIRAADRAGLRYVNGAVLVTPVGSAAVTAARGFVGTRTLGRVHQDVLIFVKGDRKAAAMNCGDVEFDLDISEPDTAP
jgi:DNA modification methylase